MAKEKTEKSRNLKLLLYPDNQQHVEALTSIQNGSFPYVGIKHISIEGGKEHWHVYLCFDNPRYTSSVAVDLGLVTALGEPDTQFCRVISGRFENALVYLIHLNCPDKEQYSFEELFGWADLIEKTKKACLKYQRKDIDMSDAIIGCLDYIRRTEGIISISDFGYWVCRSPYFRAASSGIVRGAIEEHNRKIYASSQREWISKLEDSQERYQALLAHPDIDFSEWEGDLP